MTPREIADDLIIDAGLIQIGPDDVLELRAAIGDWLRTIYVTFASGYLEVGLL